jgi:hypothetical protein
LIFNLVYNGYSSVPISSVGSMRDLTSQQPFLAQISSQSQLPVQSGYGQQPILSQSQLPVQSGYGQQPISSQSQVPVQSGYGQQPISTPNIQQDTPVSPPVPPQQPVSTGYG